jgi:hypothetical protein
MGEDILRRLLLALVIGFAAHGPWLVACAGASPERQPAMNIPWPEWWDDLPPVGGATVDVPEVGPAPPVVRPTRALLELLTSWLETRLGLPGAGDLPRVELVPRTRLAVLRYRGLVADRQVHAPPGDGPAGPLGNLRALHAVYDDDRRIIYLPDDWEGEAPAEVSVLVHELVHHLQNVARMKYSCPEERERPAYEAQARWLEMFGKTLDELGIDAFAVLVRTRCFN